MTLYVRHFRLTCELANTYVVVEGETAQAWIVDVGEMSERLVDWVQSSRIMVTGIFVTHPHFDHNGAVKDYLKIFGEIPVYGGSPACGGPTTHIVSESQKIFFGKSHAVPIHTPGHTPDHYMLFFPDDEILFSGDALFAGSVGGTSSELTKNQQLQAIRAKVLSMQPSVRVYPGHGPMTSVGIEKTANPFFC